MVYGNTVPTPTLIVVSTITPLVDVGARHSGGDFSSKEHSSPAVALQTPTVQSVSQSVTWQVEETYEAPRWQAVD